MKKSVEEIRERLKKIKSENGRATLKIYDRTHFAEVLEVKEDLVKVRAFESDLINTIYEFSIEDIEDLEIL